MNCDESFLIFLNFKNSTLCSVPVAVSYYRLVLEAAPQFSPSGELQGPTARFTGLPGGPILTQHYHVPDNWMVEAVVSPYDLDNIKLDDVENGVHR